MAALEKFVLRNWVLTRSRLLILGAILILVVISQTTTKLYAANSAPVQLFFIPLPEDQIRTALLQLYNGTGTTMHGVVGISITANNTILYYDQWENGYDPDIANPTNLYSVSNLGGTQIWGDGNVANGAPPGITNDLLNAGTVIVLENDIPIPRNPTTLLYDGRDKLGSTKVIAISKAAWSTNPGTVLAGAVEARDTTRWGTEFKIPIGQNISSSSIFEYVGLLVMASEDGTLIQIDSDGNGIVDTTQTLSQGQSYQLNGGVKSGATVKASKAVQVNLLTGDIGSTYESRWFTIPPLEQWGASYYTPVSTTNANYPANVWLFNGNTSAITIDYETKAGTGSFSVAAGAVYRFTMPLLSGAHFYTKDGSAFAALGTMDSSTSGANQSYEWGYTLVTDEYLTGAFTAGWAPGTSDLSGNGSPVWVTSIKPTTIYVDYDGNGTTGALTDPLGRKYDVAYTLSAFESKQIYDPDKNQTGMRVYTLDGTVITGVWGEDPSKANAGLPYLDIGYNIPPFPQAVVVKSGAINDTNGNHLLDPGETLQYTITAKNLGVVTFFNTIVSDTLPVEVTYVANSTRFNGTPVTDSASPPAATSFPLDEGGINVGNIPVNNTFYVTFQVTANAFPPVYSKVTNTAEVYAGGDGFQVSVTTPANGVVTQCTIDFTNASGTAVALYQENNTIYVKVADGDKNTNSATLETVTAVVQNTNNGDRETLTLTETGANTGIFMGNRPASIINGASVEDGIVKAVAGNILQVSYTDAIFADSCTDTAQITVPALVKPLYLSTDGSGSPDQDLDRIDPVATSDTSTAASVALGASSSIAIDATSKGNSNSATSLTFAHTTGAGANRLMLVSVMVGSSSSFGGNASTVGTVTYGGTALTQVGAVAESGGRVRSYIYQLLNPPSGTANVIVSLSSGSTAKPLYAGVTTFTGVHQSTPLGTYTSKTTSSTTSASLTVSSASGELVFDAIAVDGESSSNIALTASSGQTARWTTNTTNYLSGGSSTKAGASSVTMGWSWSSSNQYAIGAVAIKPAAAESTTTFTQTPVQCSALSMPAGGTINITTYVNVTSGTMPANPNLSAVLKYGTTTFATLTNPTYNSTAGTLTWSGALASNTTIPAGQAIALAVTSNQSGVSFTIQFDSTSKPSQIGLPTTTVIDITSFGLYDAPYPGGNLLTDATNGQTVYVRTTVADPFGAADIRQLTVDITSPTGSVTTVPLTTAVATSGCTKTYEYTWNTSVVQGQYNVAVTAYEGYETGAAAITDQASTPFTLNYLDTGTPSKSEFTTGNNGTATTSYSPNATICVRVTDVDQNTNPAVAETITAVIKGGGTDSETVTLTETGVNTGLFTACLPSSSTTTGTSNNGTLYAPMGAGITVTYVDPNDSSDTSNAAAVISTVTPTLSLSKSRVTPSDGVAVLGETVRFDLVVGNPGATNLNTVTVTDTFPNSCLSYQSASITPTSVVTPTISWSVGPLATGASRTISIYFRATAACAPATNSVSATATDQNNQNVSAGPTTAQVTTTRPGLTVTKTLVTPATGSPQVGDTVVFQIALQNSGSTTLTTLPLSDNYSTGCLAFASATPTPSSASGGVILWSNLGPLNAGATKTVTINFTVVGNCHPTVNQADVSAASDQNGDAVPTAQSSATVTTLGASIGDLVWYDRNNDGLYQTGEPGLAGVTVKLTFANGTVLTKTTDASGNYLFEGLRSGVYTVTVNSNTLPTGYALTTHNAPLPLTLAAGASVLTADFGYHPRGVVAGTVYRDVDANGLYDSSIDTPLSNVTVTITDTNGTVYTVQTNSSGYYSQTVAAGSTKVDVQDAQLPTGLLIGQGNTDPRTVTVPAGGTATALFPYVSPLLIDKDARTPTVVAGTAVTYTIRLYNVSAYTLINVLISDTLPLSFTYATSTLAQVNASRTSTSNPTVGATNLQWGAWRVLPGGMITLTVKANVLSSTLAGVYNNTARASSTQAGVIDDDGSAAQDSHTPYGQDPITDEDVTVTTAAALSISKFDNVDPIAAGRLLTYTIIVTNSGPSDAANVVITDTLPNGTTPYTLPAGCISQANQIVCTLGTVKANTTVKRTIVVFIDPRMTLQPGWRTAARASPLSTLQRSPPQDTILMITERKGAYFGPT